MDNSPTGIVRHRFAPAELLTCAARHIVASERQCLPDLTRCIVLIPNAHAVAAMAGAIRVASQLPALLLPRISSLAAWVEETAADVAALTPAAREAVLYAALTQRQWFAHGDRWAVASQLGALFDELTRWQVALPTSLADFTEQLEAAYQTQARRALSFEARVVHELWHAFAANGTPGPEAVFALRLVKLAEQAALPLYVVGTEGLAPVELEFLEHYNTRASVTLFERDPNASDSLIRTLHAAWPSTLDVGLSDRAGSLRTIVTESPLAGRMRIVACEHAEAEAQALDVAVREWLLQGKQSIAVVVQDRVVARRARALLERAQVLVKDEAGWLFSTTSAAAALGRLLDVVADDGYYRDVIDLMKSPFAFYDVDREMRRAAIARFEQLLRKAERVVGLGSFHELVVRADDIDVRVLLERVIGASRAFGRGRATLIRWLAALRQALEIMGIAAGFEFDSAGHQLLELLDKLERELAEDTLIVSFLEWRRWLGRQLERATFRDQAIDSPVLFTHLAATTLRKFDAVLITGGDAAHLPGPEPVGAFLNQRARAELGLPTRADTLREMQDQLTALIAGTGDLVVTWQCTVDGEQNLLSPFLQRLDTIHRLAWGRGLDDAGLATRAPQAQVMSPVGTTNVPIAAPAPRVPASLLPTRISASAYNALVACPYQFYSRYVLGLGEFSEVREEIEKSGYGRRVHDVLARFHRRHPRIAELAPADAIQALNACSIEGFRDAMNANYLDRAWLLRWQALIPDYLDWQRAREAEGWYFSVAEERREITLTTPSGRVVNLDGRIDRVDVNLNGKIAVIDYKTRRASLLKEAIAMPGENVQLAVYALLWEAPIAAALFLSIDRDHVKEIPELGDITLLAQATAARLALVFDALHDGGRLPAQGTDETCLHCEVRGLCRLDYWKN